MWLQCRSSCSCACGSKQDSVMKVVTEGEGKKKKYNKNKKKAWRKKADISDIEAILDDVRREERFG